MRIAMTMCSFEICQDLQAPREVLRKEQKSKMSDAAKEQRRKHKTHKNVKSSFRKRTFERTKSNAQTFNICTILFLQDSVKRRRLEDTVS